MFLFTDFVDIIIVLRSRSVRGLQLSLKLSCHILNTVVDCLAMLWPGRSHMPLVGFVSRFSPGFPPINLAILFLIDENG